MLLRRLSLFLLAAGYLATPVHAAADSRIEAYDLRVDGMTDPLGIDSHPPQFSWKLKAAPEARGARQTAWEIQTTSSPITTNGQFESAWSSGRIESDAQSGVTLASSVPLSQARMFWRVRVWDERDEPTEWSQPATFTMGLLSTADWATAKWITDPELLRWKRSKLGFSSVPTTDFGATEWLQLDLGKSQHIDTVRLIAVRHTVLADLGFPRRFRLEVSDSPGFQPSRVVADWTTMDHAAKGELKTKIAAGGVFARYLRFTFPHLKVDGGMARVAIGQIVVLSGTENVATGAKVSASDSVEDDRWGLDSVVDGLGVPRANSRANATLRLRREFKVGPGLKRALLDVSGLGTCNVKINGKALSGALMTPGWTDYDKTVLYVTHDVTTLLHAGDNAAGLELASGMYNVQSGGRYTKFYGPYRPLTAIAHLRLEYSDGTTEIVATDGSWRVAQGPTKLATVYGGEEFDARLDVKGWAEAGFDEKGWAHAVEGGGPSGTLRGASNSSPAFAQFQVLHPISSRVIKEGVTVYDLGQNASLMLDLRVTGPSGSSVRVIPAELTHPDGTVNRDSAGGGRCWWGYTLAGTPGGEAWRPTFFYSGCRYLQVECFPAGPGGPLPTVGSIEGLVSHSNSPQSGEFSCSDDLFNRIHTLIHWAQANNLSHVITDCPTRERLGWLEQYDLNGPSLRYEWDLSRLFRKCFVDMEDSQLASGLVPDIAPEYTVFAGGFRDSPEWGSTLVLSAWQHYVWTGDVSVLRNHYRAMQRYVGYLSGRARGDILNYGLGDWFDLGPRPPGVAQLTPVSLTGTAIFFEDMRTMARIASVLGNDADAKEYSARAESIRGAFNREFFNPQTGVYATGSQTSQAMPLVNGLVPANGRKAAMDALVHSLEQSGNSLTSGDVGYRYLLRALADGGRSDLIFEMNHRSDKPGYGYQLAHGATSLTEAWDSNPSDSQDHFMLGQIMEWFYGDLAGLNPDPDAPGFRHVIIRPHPVGGLSWARASEETTRGPVSVEWHRSLGRFTVKVDVPANSTATVVIPAPSEGEILEAGAPAAQARGVDAVSRAADGTVRIEVESGQYEFESRTREPESARR
ncbi:MAG TPA: family 78 glycoside hydrolase catalytic domain [Opitutaceae bacterium]|nr:family 78 glycoside hydrolase catalytic domain [Opitutaceae bacterium]